MCKDKISKKEKRLYHIEDKNNVLKKNSNLLFLNN